MPAVLASSARVDGNSCPSVLLFAFSMSGPARHQGGMSLPPLAVTDRETISGLCVKTRETEEWGRSGAVVQGTRATQRAVFPRIPLGRTQNFPICTHPPPAPCQTAGSGLVLVWSVCSSPWPGLLPHKDTLLVSEKNSRSASPLLFLPDRPPS